MTTFAPEPDPDRLSMALFLIDELVPLPGNVTARLFLAATNVMYQTMQPLKEQFPAMWNIVTWTKGFHDWRSAADLCRLRPGIYALK